jgi:hypothetical protein
MRCFVLIALALGLELTPLQVAMSQDASWDSVILSFTMIEGSLVVLNNAKLQFPKWWNGDGQCVGRRKTLVSLS